MRHQTSGLPGGGGADRLGGRADRLGGRLALLAPDSLSAEQRQVYDALCDLVVPEAEQGGFTARLPDGRLIGPFNALLRDPRLTSGFGQWVRAIGAGGLPTDVRETITSPSARSGALLTRSTLTEPRVRLPGCPWRRSRPS